jgi:hypothetical protein
MQQPILWSVIGPLAARASGPACALPNPARPGGVAA